MKTRFLLLALGLALAPAVPAAFAADAKPVPALDDEILLTVSATVQALNLETRELTLKGPAGNIHTVTVDPRVKRLGEVKVGDQITLDYYASIAAELRAPTEAEKAEPFVVLEEAAKAGAGDTPGAGGYRIIRSVVTVEGLDRPTSTATVKGPRGNYVVVAVKDPALLTRVRIGDTVVVVYTEALAVRLDKAPVPVAP